MWYCSPRDDGTGLRLRKCRICQCTMQKSHVSMAERIFGPRKRTFVARRHRRAISMYYVALKALHTVRKLRFEKCQFQKEQGKPGGMVCGPYNTTLAWHSDKKKVSPHAAQVALCIRVLSVVPAEARAERGGHTARLVGRDAQSRATREARPHQDLSV